MKKLGTHLLVELKDCECKKLDDIQYIQGAMVIAAAVSGATVLDFSFHEFNPQGVSGAVIIAESHLTIHTWPEYGYAAIDVFTCGDECDPWKAAEYLEKVLESKKKIIKEYNRGIPD
jgi:S-adenosylmethionine decarboxylase